MIGRRLHLRAGLAPSDILERPGDYVGPVNGWTGPVPAVFFLLPTADPEHPQWGRGECDGVHHVTSPPHTFRECADGSLEIRASIGSYPFCPDADWDRSRGYCWHGYLDEGHVWRTA